VNLVKEFPNSLKVCPEWQGDRYIQRIMLSDYWQPIGMPSVVIPGSLL